LTEKNINVSDIFSANGGGGFATEEGITHRQYNIDLMGIGNVNLSENLKLIHCWCKYCRN
jgi:hypothetical protein